MEKISALMDGELDEHQSLQQIQRLKQDEEAATGWNAFHLIGDSMRGERPLSPQFNRRLAARMAAEPTVLAPHRNPRRAAAYALSAAASLSAIALVGWMAVSSGPSVAPQPQAELARAPVAPAEPVAVTIAPAPAVLASVPSNGSMNEYLIAHQEFSPSTALQGVAPYIRSVSSTREAQGR